MYASIFSWVGFGGLGLWYLGFGFWALGSGFGFLALAVLALVSGLCGSGLWLIGLLGSGFWCIKFSYD